MNVKNIYIAKQGILDKEENLIGYEIFFRKNYLPYSKIEDPFASTIKVIDFIIHKAYQDEFIYFVNTPIDMENEFLLELDNNNIVFEFEIFNTDLKIYQQLLEKFKEKNFRISFDKINNVTIITEYSYLIDFLKIDINSENLEILVNSSPFYRHLFHTHQGFGITKIIPIIRIIS